ncbi:protein LURP-one-related 7 [Mercurialis annua]|uniref:protein LURP-one-related 7 n=1 Tax=Mercurialis annua TaxID=3986 RepID=UPI0021610033|nr:protein LURP-one-related 7 [Mercurialis annua]
MSTTSAPVYPAAAQIPVDLFVSKKYPGLSRRGLGFADSLGNLLFRVDRISPSSSSSYKWVVVDHSSGNPLFCILRQHNGSWHGFKEDGEGKNKMIFRVQRTLNRLFTTELEVFLVKDDSGESTCDFKVKGCPARRSCTIFGGKDIIAQTSLMYKLNQILARRSRFRLTIFPGYTDHALVVALVVIFLDR